jgi:hypothetical protein
MIFWLSGVASMEQVLRLMRRAVVLMLFYVRKAISLQRLHPVAQN